MNDFDKLYAELHKTPEYAAEYLSLSIAGLIRLRMQQQGITQETLADKLGVSQANIAKKLRHGQNLTLKSIAEIATALDAEWFGLELVSHEEARLRELRERWSREAEWNMAPFEVNVKGLTDEKSPDQSSTAKCA